MMLLAKSDGAADPKKIRIVEAEYRAEKGFSRTSAGFANSITIMGFLYCENTGGEALPAGLTHFL